MTPPDPQEDILPAFLISLLPPGHCYLYLCCCVSVQLEVFLVSIHLLSSEYRVLWLHWNLAIFATSLPHRYCCCFHHCLDSFLVSIHLLSSEYHVLWLHLHWNLAIFVTSLPRCYRCCFHHCLDSLLVSIHLSPLLPSKYLAWSSSQSYRRDLLPMLLNFLLRHYFCCHCFQDRTQSVLVSNPHLLLHPSECHALSPYPCHCGDPLAIFVTKLHHHHHHYYHCCFCDPIESLLSSQCPLFPPHHHIFPIFSTLLPHHCFHDHFPSFRHHWY